MKKSSKSKSAAPKIDPYIDGLMAKLLERLVHLERKMDTVISQTANRSSGNGQPQKPLHVPQAPQQPRRDRTLYEAICADCSKVCEVPFKPSEDRAVYCKECWARRKSGGRDSRPGMPVLTPVALPPKPVSKLGLPPQAPPAQKSKPAKKKTPVKAKKKKK
jgi:CxxC-x17-CxxC domain-containing protein